MGAVWTIVVQPSIFSSPSNQERKIADEGTLYCFSPQASSSVYHQPYAVPFYVRGNMIRVNRRTDYAIRVILALAKRGAGVCVSTAEIQREMLIPPALAQRIVADLARGGFIQTFPGRSGGLILARSAALINLRQIMEQFEERFTGFDCLASGGDCPYDEKCPVRCRWTRLREVILKELELTTFEDLVSEAISPADLFHFVSDQV
jgi:Rrf2 family transcriptional regulator, iron-responsive regulator